jgi:hypothetical protein
MKLIRKIVFCTAVGAVAASACNKESLHNLNIDPQSAPTINLNFFFTTAELGAAAGGSAGDNRYIDWRTNIGMASTAIQQIAVTDGIGNAGDKYQHNPETASAPFEFIYGDQLKNIAEILRQTAPGGFAEGQYPNMVQASRILRAFLFERLTDYYGNIPYTEALKGAENFFPHYDKQKDIYMDLLKEVSEATAAFGAADPTDGFAAADMYYNGDIDKWKRWGYSLMLRMAMRISNVDPATANTYVANAVAGGVFQSNDDNVIVPMAIGPSQWTDQNGISRAFYPGDGGNQSFLSKTLVDFLKGPDAGVTTDDDPRLMIISGGKGIWSPSSFTPTDVNPLTQKGMPNGHDQSQLNVIEGHNVDKDAEYSKINPKMLDLDDPYMLMNYGEVELMLAEAAERSLGGLDPSQAKAHYDAGVKASMQMYTIYDPSLSVSDGAVATYLGMAPYAYVGGTDGLKQIGTQYWVNHFLNWWEAWSNWRRTGYPELTPTNYSGNVTNGTIPQRLMYPDAEAGGNPNFGAGASPNNYTTKLWWAGGPE